MEFPSLGKHCTLLECNQLDFLPFTCDTCKNIFCKDHVSYEKHNCREAYKKDIRVPVCPLCNQPVSFKPGDIPDRNVNEHIENDCKSDLALAKRKTYTNKCSAKGCKQRELVPVTCATCKRNFCLRHRHENDHECLKNDKAVNSPRKSAASLAAGQAAASRFESYNTSRRTQPQNTFMSSVGSDLNRERNSRKHESEKTKNSSRTTSTANTQSNIQTGMTEDEALAFAIQASLSDNKNISNESKETSSADTDEDLALARALAQSEIDERNRQRRSRERGHEHKESGCSIS